MATPAPVMPVRTRPARTPRTSAPAPPPPTTLPAHPSPRGRSGGRMRFELRRLPEPLVLNQVSRDPAWDFFKTIMTVIGGLLVFLVFGTGMYVWGQGGVSSTPSAPPPTIIYTPAPVPPSSTPPSEPTPEERARRYREHLYGR